MNPNCMQNQHKFKCSIDSKFLFCSKCGNIKNVEFKNENRIEFNIFIKISNGKKFSLNITPETTIIEIKEKIKKFVGNVDFYLTCGSHMLMEDKTIGYYNIFKDSIIFCITRLRGGKPIILFSGFIENENVRTKVILDKKLLRFSYVYPQPDTIIDQSCYQWDFTFKDYLNLYSEKLNKSFSYIFWEADTFSIQGKKYFDELLMNNQYFCFKKEDILDKLDLILTKMGMTINERNDMITYWIQKLTMKKYTLAYFMDTNSYCKIVKLEISPKPKQTIRIFMLFKPIEYSIKSKAEISDIKQIERNSNNVLEWGAMHIN